MESNPAVPVPAESAALLTFAEFLESSPPDVDVKVSGLSTPRVSGGSGPYLGHPDIQPNVYGLQR